MGRRRARRAADAARRRHATLTAGLDLDGELATLDALRLARRSPRAKATSTSSASRPATTSPPIAWHATHDRRRRPRRARRRAPAASPRRSALRARRVAARPRAGSRRASAPTPAIGSQQILLDRRSARLGAARASPTSSTLRADGGRYHQARDASDTSAVFGTPDLGLEQAWHAIAGAPVAARAVRARGRGLRALARRSRRARSRGHAAARAGAHAGRHRPRRSACRSPRAWSAGTASRAGSATTCRAAAARTPPDQPWRYFDHDQTHGLIAVAGWEHGPWTLGGRVRYATGEPRTAGDRRVLRQPRAAATSRSSARTTACACPRSSRPTCAPSAGSRSAALHGAVYLEIQNLTEPRERRGDHLQRRLLAAGLPDQPAAARDRGREDRAMKRVRSLLLALAGCQTALDQRLAIVDRAARARDHRGAAEAKPGATVALRALVAAPDGPIAATAARGRCATRRSRRPRTTRSPTAASATIRSTPLGDARRSPATIPTDACRTFGPDVAARRLPPARSRSDRRLLPAGARRTSPALDLAFGLHAHHVQPRERARRRRARLPARLRREHEPDARAARDSRRDRVARRQPTSRSPRLAAAAARRTSTTIRSRRRSSRGARRCACRGSRPRGSLAVDATAVGEDDPATDRVDDVAHARSRPGVAVARAARQPRRHRDADDRRHGSVITLTREKDEYDDQASPVHFITPIAL